MDSSKVLVIVAVLSFYIEVVEGCLRLKCYRCNSLDSPTTCDKNNFDEDYHKGDVVVRTDLHLQLGGSSCVSGYLKNHKGVSYYYRAMSLGHQETGCVGKRCACNIDLCNGSTSMHVTSALFWSYLLSFFAHKLCF
ncbi:uncharacterized protein LOC132714379 [Ruditapes philippinarum]|uniref:uncharacterized protein LOC132714379 n=1 Tax=Ruditapes philippinarum TaxID=129788 RepID=UPI00295B6EC4|nr:uncharacterized protein LOC132714379 [Ruditapes philippinarum]